MKKCSKCLQAKSLEEFSWKNKSKGKKAAECKHCHSIMRQKYYSNNTEKEKSRIKERKLEIKEWYNGYKSTLSCTLCNEGTLEVLCFHHIDPASKRAEVSTLVTNGCSINTIMLEIQKCMVVCFNCHMKIHAGLV